MSDLIIDSQRISNLYEVLKSYAPDDDARAICQKFIYKTENRKELILNLVTAITDGLLYGNWPWCYPKKLGASR